MAAEAAFAVGRAEDGGLAVLAGNAALGRLTGLWPEQAVGRAFSAALSALGIAEPADRLLAVGAAATRTVRGCDGDRRPRWWELAFHPLPGDTPRWVCFVRDAGARAGALAALGAGVAAPPAAAGDDAGLDAVLAALPEGVAILRPGAPFLRANRAALQLLGAGDAAAAQAALLALAPAARADAPPARVTLPDVAGGPGRAVLLCVVALGPGPDPALLCLLRAADGAGAGSADLLATICHELRTPLAAVSGALDLLAADDAAAAPQRARLLAMARRNCARLADLTEDMGTACTGADAGLSVAVRQLAVADVLAEAREAHETLARGRGVALAVHDGAPGAALIADPRRLQQVLGNLIANAVKFSPRGGTVRLSAEPDGDGVAFRVADDGPGIAAAWRARVFERFARAPQAAGVPGTGLGLAIARDLVARQGGRITLTSRTAGEPGGAPGTEVRVMLPAAGRVARAG